MDGERDRCGERGGHGAPCVQHERQGATRTHGRGGLRGEARGGGVPGGERGPSRSSEAAVIHGKLRGTVGGLGHRRRRRSGLSDTAASEGLLALRKRYGRALRREVRYQAIPPDEFEAGLRTVGEAAAADIAAVYRWMAENEDSRLFVSDPEEIHERFQTELMDLEKWANQREWTGPAMK